MNRIFSSNSIASSDSYNSLKDLDKPNHIKCPICLMETEDNTIFQCKHGVCKLCFQQLSKNGVYKCPCCRKEYGSGSSLCYILDALAYGNFSIGGLSV